MMKTGVDCCMDKGVLDYRMDQLSEYVGLPVQPDFYI